MKANKKPSAFKLWLLRIVPASLIAALTMAASCKKPEDPKPEPTKVITLDFDWLTPYNTTINLKEIKDLTNQPDVKNVILKLRDNDYTPTGFAKHNFKRARDSLDTRFAINREKITGEGKIYLSHDTQKDQIEDDDSLYFVMNGFVFVRYGYNKSQSYQ